MSYGRLHVPTAPAADADLRYCPTTRQAFVMIGEGYHFFAAADSLLAAAGYAKLHSVVAPPTSTNLQVSHLAMDYSGLIGPRAGHVLTRRAGPSAPLAQGRRPFV
jgi:hypothetical protein